MPMFLVYRFWENDISEEKLEGEIGSKMCLQKSTLFVIIMKPAKRNEYSLFSKNSICRCLSFLCSSFHGIVFHSTSWLMLKIMLAFLYFRNTERRNGPASIMLCKQKYIENDNLSHTHIYIDIVCCLIKRESIHLMISCNQLKKHTHRKGWIIEGVSFIINSCRRTQMQFP